MCSFFLQLCHFDAECDGTGEDYLNSENVFQFAGCTKVKGRLRILDLTFSW